MRADPRLAIPKKHFALGRTDTGKVERVGGNRLHLGVIFDIKENEHSTP